ncbi:ATP-binding cassette domain-containing protein [Pannus brasiliensis CCIBt3594]|uniref:ATP-binding cassette domain-containing protein n=1 Tax=Pannus brasiliensis CCIBt3594 TaxID=1427578 RepID=A0AAW9QWV1_9CHRO
MSIFVENVSKRIAGDPILDRVNFRVLPGSIVALTGISGSGKTSLLRLLAGLETADSGSVETSSRTVYAHPAPFEKLTVRENIAFGLQIRHRSKREIREKVEEVLQFLNLQALGDRYPGKLSAGHRHRLALGRVMAIEPDILLLDEPFDLLDPVIRQRSSSWLRQRADLFGATILLATRHLEIAREICDRALVLHEGRIAREYSPIDPYELLALKTSLELEERKKQDRERDYSVTIG